jgi:hypothetical protein
LQRGKRVIAQRHVVEILARAATGAHRSFDNADYQSGIIVCSDKKS